MYDWHRMINRQQQVYLAYYSEHGKRYAISSEEVGNHWAVFFAPEEVYKVSDDVEILVEDLQTFLALKPSIQILHFLEKHNVRFELVDYDALPEDDGDDIVNRPNDEYGNGKKLH
jgi:hypothetical protein